MTNPEREMGRTAKVFLKRETTMGGNAPGKKYLSRNGKRENAKSLIVAKVTEMSTMRLINSNHGTLMTNPQKGKWEGKPEILRRVNPVMRNIKRSTVPRK